MALIVASPRNGSHREGGHLFNVCAYAERKDRSSSFRGASLERDLPGIKAGSTVHVVTVEHLSEGTFTKSVRHSQVLGIFSSAKKARGLVKAALATKGTCFTHESVKYSASWLGHFETLESVDLWECKVRKSAPDPYGDPPALSPRIRSFP